MARSKLIKDFINSTMSIETALQNLLAILYCFNDDKLINWVKQELQGYDQNVDSLPEYRKVQGTLMASYFVGYAQYPKRPFMTKFLDEEFRNNLLCGCVYSSVSTLEKMKDDKECSIQKPVTPEYFPILEQKSNAKIIAASVEVDKGSINDILSKVRTKILDTLLFLENQFGSLDDLDIDLSTKSEEEIEKIIQYIQVNLYDNSISIGDNNKIKGSDIITNK